MLKLLIAIVRSVFNKTEVVNKEEQPQQKNVDKSKNIVEEEVVTKVKDEKKTSTPQKKEKIIEQKIEERYDRPCRKDYNLYTIVATIKIGNDKFVVQRIVEEKSEKLANIEYDRMIKKEFGKPKSVTKRNCKEYENGEKNFCEDFVEEIPKEIQKSPEEVILEKKIELLQGDYMGLYKIMFNKNNFVKDTQYIFASSREDVDTQIDFILKQDGHLEEKKLICSKIRSITRLDSNAMKTDKGCLKRLKECSIENIEELISRSKKLQEDIKKEAEQKYKELIKRGFKLYVGKLLPKGKEIFVELARNEDEAHLIILAEDRVHRIMLSGQKIEGAAVKEVEEIVKNSDTLQAFKSKDLNLDEIGGLAKKDDIIYTTLFGKKTVEEYIQYVDNAKVVMESIRNGGVDKLLQDKVKEITKKISGDDKMLDKILQVDKMERNLFGSSRETLRALLNK